MPRYRTTQKNPTSTGFVIATLIASSTALADVKIANRAEMLANRSPLAMLEVQTDGSATDNALLVRGPIPSSTQLLLVRDDGNVAIGSSAPEYRLDVQGTARITDTPTITGSTTFLAKDPATGQLSEQLYTSSNSMPLWIDDGPVVFSALTTTRAAGTAPTIDANAHSNVRRYRDLGNGWIQEEIEIASNGSGGVAGVGTYIFDTKFPIDTTYHVTYPGNLETSLYAAGRTYGINLGRGVLSQTGWYVGIYAIPISGSEIAFASINGSTGNKFVRAGHLSISTSQWSMKIQLEYKKGA
ncbi:hypothetical protein OAS86_04170 [Gammaproteobacteria bacterium]|nr:hypothetical protein [Gammaproteobacteria bacterium]